MKLPPTHLSFVAVKDTRNTFHREIITNKVRRPTFYLKNHVKNVTNSGVYIIIGSLNVSTVIIDMVRVTNLFSRNSW